MRKLLLLLAALFALPLHAQVSATIDRFTIQPGGTVKLTLETDQQFVNSPDLSPLYDDFRILGSKKMTISSKTGDGKQFSARWQVLIRPKHPGNLTIPALQVGNESSPELMVTVESRRQRQQGSDSQDNFPGQSGQSTFELVADGTELYVGSQMKLTLRLLLRDDLPRDTRLPTPQVIGATLKAFGNQEQRQSVRRGQALNVIEQRYLLFPHQPGRLSIPEQIFSFDQNGISQQVVSLPLAIDVLPQAFQKNRGYWIPATEVTLEDNLESPFAMEVGQAVDRVITMTAVGVTAESLPALSPLRNELAQVEVIDVALYEEFTDKGISSTRQETVRITPHERGEVTLKAISIPWWNTSQDRNNDAVLNTRIIQVSPTSVEQPVSNPITEDEPEQLADVSNAQPEQAAKSASGWSSILMTIIGLALAGGAAFFGWRHYQAKMEENDVPQESDEQTAFQALSMACQQDNPILAQQALLLWAQNFWSTYPINDNDDICQLAGSETFDILITNLEENVDDDAGIWRGDLLLEAVEMIRSLNEQPVG